MITAFCGKDRPCGLMAFGCDSFRRCPEEGVCRENTPHRMNEITGCSSDGRARGLGAGTRFALEKSANPKTRCDSSIFFLTSLLLWSKIAFDHMFDHF